MNDKRRLYQKWVHLINEQHLYERCSALTYLFEVTSKKAKKNFGSMFYKKQYHLKGVNAINKYFVQLTATTEDNINSTMEAMH